MAIFVLKKSPTLKIQIGGAPNDVFSASFCNGLPSGPITGIVLPGLRHCCKNVNLEFNPSGVIEWNDGLKNAICCLIPSYRNGSCSLIRLK